MNNDLQLLYLLLLKTKGEVAKFVAFKTYYQIDIFLTEFQKIYSYCLII
jgi:hypothetical protein